MSKLFFYSNKPIIEQAVGYINQALEVVVEQEKQLIQNAYGTEQKIMPVKQCNMMGKVLSSVGGYKEYQFSQEYGVTHRSSSGWFTPKTKTVSETCDLALQHAEWLFEQGKQIHEENIPNIEINKSVEKVIRDFMKKVGIPSTHTYYDYVSSSGRRTQKRQEHTKTAGFIDDIQRTIKTGDGFEQSEKDLKSYKERVEVYRQVELKKEKDAIQKQQAEEQAKVDTKVLSTLLVKYNLPYESDWDAVLETILSKNKYLDLAYWLERQRNDWSDGFWKAQRGLENFTIETPEDQAMYDSLSNVLITAEDGREFRDCEYNYSYIFGLVEDEELMKDYGIVRERITDI